MRHACSPFSESDGAVGLRESCARLVGFQVSDAESPVRSPRAILKGGGFFQKRDGVFASILLVVEFAKQLKRTGVIGIDLNRFFKMLISGGEVLFLRFERAHQELSVGLASAS